MEAVRNVKQYAHHVMAFLKNAGWRMTHRATRRDVGYHPEGDGLPDAGHHGAHARLFSRAPFHGLNGAGPLS